MIRTALSLAFAILVVEIPVASADTYPDSFADYLNARGLYFAFLSRAEETYWVRTSAGDIVLRMPHAVAPKISVVPAEGQPSDSEVAGIRSNVELALSSALDRLGVRRCSSDQASCIPFALQIGFSIRHDDVIYMPNLRDSTGRQIASFATRLLGSEDRSYRMGCGSNAEISARGDVVHLDAAFTFEVAASDTPPSNVSLTHLMTPLTFAMEECMLELLGVPIPEDLPRQDIAYYVARSLETLYKAESHLTQDQTATDVPGLVMTMRCGRRSARSRSSAVSDAAVYSALRALTASPAMLDIT
ncbi:hypothetical protein [Dongia sp.]|uniref:hypothetical protein n=1 Tax=Dongia sp. TaxID=1977262 RepID=UPI003753AC7D